VLIVFMPFVLVINVVVAVASCIVME
jgi:hypothetical protein